MIIGDEEDSKEALVLRFMVLMRLCGGEVTLECFLSSRSWVVVETKRNVG